jgi:hypothetical protein
MHQKPKKTKEVTVSEATKTAGNLLKVIYIIHRKNESSLIVL